MNVILHGIIAKKFKSRFNFAQNIKRDHVLEAIESRQPSFKVFIKRLATQNMYYEIVQENEDYHIIPVIHGNIGAVLAVITNPAMLSTLVGFGTNLALNGLNSLMTPEDTISVSKQVVLQGSRLQSLRNEKSQGLSIPLGYGRLKIGSSVIQQYKESVDVSNTASYSESFNLSEGTGPRTEYSNPTLYETK